MSEQPQVTWRNLTDGYQQSPLRHFKGRLDNIITEMRTFASGNKQYHNLNFSEINVIETVEPYPFPIAQLAFPSSDRKKSGWGVLGQSGLKFLAAAEDVAALQGTILELKMTPGHMMWNRDVGSETPRECWEIVGAEREGGVATPTPGQPAANAANTAIDLLIGKTEQEWNQLVFANPIVKADSGLIAQILARTFLPSLEAADIISKDEAGIYSRVVVQEA